MPNERTRAELNAVIEQVGQQFRTIAQIQRDRADLTASATARKRVTVTVNADGVVIETKFAGNIADLEYSEIAKAVTEAAQQAAAEVGRKGQALMEPLNDQRARMPKLTDLIEGMPDFAAHPPAPVPASTAPPHARESGGAAMEFDDVEVVRPEGARDRGVTDSGW
ncbi:YbaB/EbfC family nucleoid-associated protein [Nocardia jiangsuensis]|uniref:YbaB/EbfC family nucleoid-associated protein n=1 Tax=Nocardia jiangsuensis TaxID=1691563 RepID=A0ABV8DYY5_9NOCA